MFTDTNGGVEPNDVTEEAVNPIGSPFFALAVSIAIPLA
jgi:hypothetical protein